MLCCFHMPHVEKRIRFYVYVYCSSSRSTIFHSFRDVTVASEWLLLGAGMTLYRAIPTERYTGPRFFWGLTRRTAPLSRLVRQARGSTPDQHGKEGKGGKEGIHTSTKP